MKRQAVFCLALVVCAALAVRAQEEESTTEVVEPTSTPNPGQEYGALCNGILLRCNRHSETVACMQRRADPTTTTEAEPPTTEDSENPIFALFNRKLNPTPNDICETGLGVDLGRCQCIRNCKNGQYVDDGEFDPAREICVGLVGSACSLLRPQCTVNGRCNFLSSTCVCDQGFVASDRRCVPAK